MQKKIKVWSSH